MRSLGQACVRRPRLVLGIWLVVLLAGFATTALLFSRLDGQFEGAQSSEAVRAQNVISEHSSTDASLDVLVDHVDPSTPATLAALDDWRTAVLAVEHVAEAAVPTVGADGTTSGANLIAYDGKAALLVVEFDSGISSEELDTAIDAVKARSADLENDLNASDAGVGGTPTVTTGGLGAALDDINAQLHKDLIFAEAVALPITALVLIFVFAGLIPALVPIIGAVAAIGGGFLILLGFSFVIDLSSQVVPVVTMLALGLSIDYALLVVSRFREERAAGADIDEAVVRTVERAGRTVMFSAVIVAISLAGLFAFAQPIFKSVAAAGVSVVIVALLSSVTLVPVVLSKLGHRIKIVHVTSPGTGRFARLARAVQRRAVIVFLLVAAVLITLAAPVLQIRLTSATFALLPADNAVRQMNETITERFPGREALPVVVIAEIAPEDLQSWADSATPEFEAAGLLRSASPAGPLGDPDSGWSIISLIPEGGEAADEPAELVSQLRADRPDPSALVTGNAAFLDDFTDAVLERAPWAIALVILATFVLLFLLTGSVLIPLKALVMNVLSLGASFGALVLIFQKGYGESLLNFTSDGAIEVTVPVLVLAFAFGLSMDYEVFLLSRIVEERGDPENAADTNHAVALGLQRSGRIITSAALLVIIVFLGFVTADMLILKEMGIALAIAVFVDATIIRMLLVPATMTLMGRANWWAPAPLRRLHQRLAVRH